MLQGAKGFRFQVSGVSDWECKALEPKKLALVYPRIGTASFKLVFLR
jgi:hypothetical protein